MVMATEAQSAEEVSGWVAAAAWWAAVRLAVRKVGWAEDLGTKRTNIGGRQCAEESQLVFIWDQILVIEDTRRTASRSN